MKNSLCNLQSCFCCCFESRCLEHRDPPASEELGLKSCTTVCLLVSALSWFWLVCSCSQCGFCFPVNPICLLAPGSSAASLAPLFLLPVSPIGSSLQKLNWGNLGPTSSDLISRVGVTVFHCQMFSIWGLYYGALVSSPMKEGQ